MITSGRQEKVTMQFMEKLIDLKANTILCRIRKHWPKERLLKTLAA